VGSVELEHELVDDPGLVNVGWLGLVPQFLAVLAVSLAALSVHILQEEQLTHLRNQINKLIYWWQNLARLKRWDDFSGVPFLGGF